MVVDMDFEKFKDWVVHYAVHGDVPESVRDEFERLIEDDEECSAYFDTHLKIKEYMRSHQAEHQEWKGEVQKQAKFALTSIESGASPSELPKKSLDCLVYVLGDRASKAWQAKDYKEALSILNQILLYRPDDHMAHVMLGDVHYDLKEYKEAIGHYSAVLDSGSLPDEVRPMVMAHIGLSHAQLGDFAKAEGILLEAMGAAPEDSIVLNNLGIFYLMRSRYAEALEVLKKAEPLMEEDFGESGKTAAVLGNLAMAYFELGDRANSLRYINAALQIDPESDNLKHNQDIISGASEGVLLLLI
jgi:tetratricopeptide (TPR) repeat protein